MPAGVALVKGGPKPDLGIKFINEMLAPETQATDRRDLLDADQQGPPCRPAAEIRRPRRVDWEYFADNRAVWIERWDPRRRCRQMTSRRRRTFRDVTGAREAFGSATVLSGFALGRARRVRLAARAVRLRQDHAAAHHRGTARARPRQHPIAGRELTRVPPHERNIGVVFQSYALFPHLTVAENVAFGCKARRRDGRRSPRACRQLCRWCAWTVRRSRRTSLSGGQQQRIAVARSIVVKPTLLLLDEPFSALDRKLRETMQIELRRLLRDLGITSIFVTHDQDEALVMCDRIAVMNRGASSISPSPPTIYGRPKSLRARLRRTVDAAGRHGRRAPERRHGRVATASAGTRGAGARRPAAQVLLAVRPERITLDAARRQLSARRRCATWSSRAPKSSSISTAPRGQVLVETAELAAAARARHGVRFSCRRHTLSLSEPPP